jgi:hypothetical protein
MPKASCRFRHSELTRAIKAAKVAGVDKFRIDIDPNGTISLTVGESAVAQPIKDLTDAVRREREEDRRARRFG